MTDMRNFITGVAYTGSNALRLQEAAIENGFGSPYWLTYRQACEKKLSVRGQHGTKIIRIVKKKIIDDVTKKPKVVSGKKIYTVFNMSQCKSEAAV